MARFILRHKVSVILAWVILCALSIAFIGELGQRLDYTYSTPGEPGYEANLKITQRFGLDAEFEAMIPVLDLPQGMTMKSEEGRTRAAQEFNGAYDAGPLAVGDFSNTGDPMSILDDARAAWAMITI